MEVKIEQKESKEEKEVEEKEKIKKLNLVLKNKPASPISLLYLMRVVYNLIPDQKTKEEVKSAFCSIATSLCYRSPEDTNKDL